LMLVPDSVELLPPDLRAALSDVLELNEALTAVADEAVLWGPQFTEIVPVQSVGHFPAEFNIEAYKAPSGEFVRPLFAGEPPVAEGFLCAVRAGHPDVVSRPLTVLDQQCLRAAEGPCDRHYGFFSSDVDAYFVESFRCPSRGSASDECERSTRGDITARRNYLGSFIEGSAEPSVVYLAEPAAAGSYTAWKYGSPDGLSAGFHLFSKLPFTLNTAPLDQREPGSCGSADDDAYVQVLEQHSDRYRMMIVGGLAVDNIQLDPVLRETYERTLAELTMERCPMPEPEPISHTQPLKVLFSNDNPLTFSGQELLGTGTPMTSPSAP